MERKKFKSKFLVLYVFLVILIFLNIIPLIPFSYSQINDDPFTIHSKFKMLELGESRGETFNTSTIEFSLPSESWNLTEVELNFTSIKFKREVFPIEDELGIYHRILDKQEKGLAVQINLTEPTKIFGVHIFGDEFKPTTTTTVMIQINGYDSISHQPNNTRYGYIPINMTPTAGWYIQNFSSPIILPKGRYYLVLNGSEMLPSDNGKYHWFQNNINPKNPDLFIWEHVGGIWTNNATKEPLLYKLDQKVIKDFQPEENNMSIRIGENFYSVLNEPPSGSGFLNTSIDFFPNSTVVPLPVSFNTSFSVHFNLSYRFQAEKFLISQASGVIEENSAIKWTMNPNIQRYSIFNIFTIKFTYPTTWKNLTIYRNIGSGGVNITSLVIINKATNQLILPNNTIVHGSEWRFAAASLPIDCSFENFPVEQEPGKEFIFGVITPNNIGNLTFFIEKPSGESKFIERKEFVSGTSYISYEIPSNWTDGSYKAKVYWNNATDGGLIIREFLLKNPPPPPTRLTPIQITIIVLISVGILAAGIISFQGIKILRKRHVEKTEKLYNQCADILNLDYIMVTDKNSGLNLYIQNFSEKEIEASLISGFLQAIHSFGIELIKVEDKTQTIKLEYQDSIVIMTEFVNLRIILLMNEHPSRFFLYSLEELAYDIYKNFGEAIDSFDGDVHPFRGIENLLKQQLNASFVYPIKLASVEKIGKMRISQRERLFIDKAVSLMKMTNQDRFLIKAILPGKECNPKDVEVLLNLMDKGIFQLDQ